MNFNIIDLIIIILLGLGAVKGYRRGFIGSLVGLFGTFISLILSIRLYKPVVALLNEKFAILTIVHEFLIKNLPLPLEVSSAPINAQGLDILAARIEEMFFPLFLKEKIMETAWDLSFTVVKMGITTIGELFTYILANILINGIIILLLWFIIGKAFWLISIFFTNSLDHTFLGGLNRLAGLVVGTLLNTVVLMVIIGIMSIFFGSMGQASPHLPQSWLDAFNQSVLIPYFVQGYGFFLNKSVFFI